MKKNLVAIMAIGMLIFGLFGVAQAAPITFNDNFDTENSGVGILNYNKFQNWTVSDGTVDLIGNGYFEWFNKEHGLYVDMDGSTGNAGKISTNLTPGNYSLSYSLAGSQRTGSQNDSVIVSLGNTTLINHNMAYNEGFQTYTTTFLVDSETTLSFEGLGNDNMGLLLDNVVLSGTPTPVPAAVWLLGSGLAGLVALRRKKRDA
ncbi:MAG: VPLPA-CTERM sorting domain-containing protein [Desulfamplus sp.]|nr:VPLPA-CTERM sorting domain-containing protein [Desulfamplus sp.]